MKNIKQLATVLAIASILSACSSTPLPQELEFKILCFDRNSPKEFEKEINELAAEGWSNNGPLDDEGVNVYNERCVHFLFQRRKTGK